MKDLTICTACGTEFPDSHHLPELCPVCNDDRQFIPPAGQSWTSSSALKVTYRNKITKINERLYSITTEPQFAIAQRCFFVTSPDGNVLWDCISLLDEQTIAFIRSKGGLSAIAFSHPHFYTTMNEWAAVFGCPIHIHHKDEGFVSYKTNAVRFWEGDSLPLWDDISIVHTGGHFPGSCMLSVKGLSPGGTMLCGDSLYIARSRRHTAVMFSYPNQIILPKPFFHEFYNKVINLKFDTLHGASFDGQSLEGNAHPIFIASMNRYKENYAVSELAYLEQ
jgi:hypothetical protein